MLLFIGKTKRSMSDGKAMGKSRDVGEWCPLQVRIPEGRWGRRRGEEGESKLSGGDEIGKSGVTRACLFPIWLKSKGSEGRR